MAIAAYQAAIYLSTIMLASSHTNPQEVWTHMATTICFCSNNRE